MWVFPVGSNAPACTAMQSQQCQLQLQPVVARFWQLQFGDAKSLEVTLALSHVATSPLNDSCKLGKR